jgi:hypothetical protein
MPTCDAIFFNESHEEKSRDENNVMANKFRFIAGIFMKNKKQRKAFNR